MRLAPCNGKRRTAFRECLPLQGLPAKDRRNYALRRILQQIAGSYRRSRKNLYPRRRRSTAEAHLPLLSHLSDLDDFARGGISIGEGMIVDELFHAAARSYFSTPRITIFSASSWVSFGHRGGFCPAFLLSAIGRNRMRQEDAGAQHNKSSYSKRDHRAHHVARPDTGFRHTSRPSK